MSNNNKKIKVHNGDDLDRIVHDMKLPLTVMQSIVDIMFKGNEQAEIENYIFMLDRNIKYLTRLTSDIQDNRSETNLEEDSYCFDIFGYTEMLVNSVSTVCEIKGIEIDFKNSKEQYFECYLNWKYYERIILNVIQNSIKHALYCKYISVFLECEHTKIKIYITDDGKNKIKTKEEQNTNSTGQGLFIITALAKKMNAKLKHSFEEDGMKFLLEIPLENNELIGEAYEFNATQLNLDLF